MVCRDPSALARRLLADPQAAIGRSLGWTYIDTEIYDVRSGTFRSHRVLQAIPE